MRFICTALSLLFFSNLSAQHLSFITDFGNHSNPELFEFAAINDITTVNQELFLLDPVLGQIHLLEFNKDTVRRTGNIKIQAGRGPGELQNLSNLAVSEHYIAISDARNQKIVLLDRKGVLISEFVTRFRPTRLYLHNDRLLVSGFWPTVQGELIHVFNIQGELVRNFVPKPENWIQVAQTGNFERLLPAEDFLYVSYPSPMRIEKYDWSGRLAGSFNDPAKRGNIVNNGDLHLIETRIVDLAWKDHSILALVTHGDIYSIELFDTDLKHLKSVPAKPVNSDHISFLRMLGSDHVVIRQIEPVHHIQIYRLETN
ncbi:MAG: hypothetical protein EA364_10220 [Balneolaceae bacterium]|nr:MAG: hypothetical protein EA364_10220 [Balneolaceae bacterium]